MNKELLDLVYKLINDIKQDERYISYNKAKEELSLNNEVYKLNLKKQDLFQRLNHLKEEGSDEESILRLKLELNKVEEELNSIPIFKECKTKEKEFNEIIDLINKELFDKDDIY